MLSISSGLLYYLTTQLHYSFITLLLNSIPPLLLNSFIPLLLHLPQVERALNQLRPQGVAFLPLIHAPVCEAEAFWCVAVLAPHAVVGFVRVDGVAEVAGDYLCMSSRTCSAGGAMGVGGWVR